MAAHPETEVQLTRRAALTGLVGMAFAAEIAGGHRSAANRARDPWRKPLETITFFGIEPHHAVVEILPGSVGYWLEILAPYLRDRGLYIAAGRDEEATAA